MQAGVCVKPMTDFRPMSASSRRWICWIWYGYNHSLFNVSQTLTCGTWRCVKIFQVLTCGLRSEISITLSSSYTLHRSGDSSINTPQNEPFSHKFCWTRLKTLIWDSSLWKLLSIFLDDGSSIAIVNSYTKCISAYFSLANTNSIFTVTYDTHISEHNMTAIFVNSHATSTLACMNRFMPAACICMRHLKSTYDIAGWQ
jgi:hypothetical protein